MSAGGSTSFDLIIALIADRYGHKLAQDIGLYFLHDNRGTGDTPTEIVPGDLMIRRPNKTVERCVAVMLETLDEPLEQPALADMLGVSVRHLQRIVRDNTGQTVAQLYMRLRLVRARDLLRSTSLSVLEVAVGCGFASDSHFAKVYRDRYGVSPRADRGARRLIQLR